MTSRKQEEISRTLGSPESRRQTADSLRLTAGQGFLWAGGAQALSQSLHILIRLILANILLPAEFGLVAMATVVLGVTSLVSDLGLGNAMIQRPELGESHKSTSFWFNGAVGVSLFAVTFLCAPVAGWFFAEARVVPVLRVLSFSLLLSAPESTYSALLMRRMDFKSLGIRQILATVVAGSAGIWAALAGLGVWSLVIHALTQGVAGSALLAWRAGWWPGWHFSRKALLDLWTFGRWVAGGRAVNYLNRNGDTLLIGRFLGTASLGFYSLAYQSILVPLQYIVRPMARVGLPAFATIQNDPARTHRALLETLELVILTTWPIAALGAFTAPAAVPLILGEQWIPAIPAFQLLSIVGAVQAVVSLSFTVFEGTGRPKLGMKFLLIAMVGNLLGFVAGLPWGITGVAAGYLAANLLTLPIHYWLVLGLLEAPVRPLITLFTRGTGACLVLGSAWQLLQPLLDPSESLARFLTSIALVLLCYGLISFLLLRDGWILSYRTLHQLSRT